jgi:hypothetical protein
VSCAVNVFAQIVSVSDRRYSTVFILHTAIETNTTNLSEMGNQCSQVCQEPTNPCSEMDRRNTFPNDWCYYDFKDLARLGFVYTGFRDVVQCVYCKFLMEAEIETTLTHDAHMKCIPKCPFLHGQNVGNICIHSTDPESMSPEPAVTTQNCGVDDVGILDMFCSFVACANIFSLIL